MREVEVEAEEVDSSKVTEAEIKMDFSPLISPTEDVVKEVLEQRLEGINLTEIQPRKIAL